MWINYTCWRKCIVIVDVDKKEELLYCRARSHVVYRFEMFLFGSSLCCRLNLQAWLFILDIPKIVVLLFLYVYKYLEYTGKWKLIFTLLSLRRCPAYNLFFPIWFPNTIKSYLKLLLEECYIFLEFNIAYNAHTSNITLLH